MLIEVHAQDEAILRSIAEYRRTDPEAFVASLAPEDEPQRVLAVLDARTFTTDAIRSVLAHSQIYGDKVLILVDTIAKIMAADANHAQSNVDFLVWPTSPLILATRLRLLRRQDDDAVVVQRQGAKKLFPESSFRFATEWLPTMIVATDAASSEVFINAAVRRFLGTKSEHAMASDLIAGFHTDDRAELATQFEAGIVERRLFEVSARMLRADNQWRMIHIIGRPHYDQDGSYAGIVASWLDVTEQRQAEALLRASTKIFKEIANMVPLLIWQLDAEGQVTFANERWYTYTGFSEHPLSWEKWLEIVHPEDRQRIAMEWERDFRNGETMHAEGRIREKSTGLYKWHRHFATPIRNDAGIILKWIGSAIDIDRRRQNADKIKYLYHELEIKSQAKDTFLAILSHELRTPLNIILGYCHLILETAEQEDFAIGALQGILHCAQEVLDFVEELPWKDLSSQ